MTLQDLLSRLVPALERTRVPYMLTGSVASSAHGEPRSTLDLDIVISPSREQLVTLMREFPSNSYYADEQQAMQALVKRSQFKVIDFATVWKVDFIIAEDSEYSRMAIARRVTINMEGTSVNVASPEDVLIAKLRWAKLAESERQLRDCVGILNTQRARLDRSYIERWVRELQLEHEWVKVEQGRF